MNRLLARGGLLGVSETGAQSSDWGFYPPDPSLKLRAWLAYHFINACFMNVDKKLK